MRQEFHTIKDQKRWGVFARSLLMETEFTTEFKDQFESFWIEAGHHIREQVADDQTLVRLLRYLLPTYQGEAFELFRGENRSRWENGNIGLAWTPSIETARMFASGLNAVRSGGVLLKAHFEPSSIISSPNEHSNHLGESQFTVDPSTVGSINAIAFFHAAHDHFNP
jgi:hypothetical protein